MVHVLKHGFTMVLNDYQIHILQYLHGTIKNGLIKTLLQRSVNSADVAFPKGKHTHTHTLVNAQK